MKPEKEDFQLRWAGVDTHGYWKVPNPPRAVVVLVHGFGEHSGRYLETVVPVLNGAGLAVLGFDLVGHGRSGGKRGHCKGYGQLMDQLGCACNYARDAFPTLPLFLYGHSMGGNLVLNLVLRKLERPTGVVASSPYLRLAFKPPAWKVRAGQILERLMPSITIPSGLDPKAISRDPGAVEAYRSDPLVHDRISPKYAFPVIEAGEKAILMAKQWDLPLFMAHGTGDQIIDHRGSIAFCEAAAHSQLYLHPGGYHELHHDLDSDQYFQRLRNWCDTRVPNGS